MGGESIGPPKIEAQAYLPFLARVRFESLQRGELDPFLWRRERFAAYCSVFLYVFKILSINPCLSSSSIFFPSERVD